MIVFLIHRGPAQALSPELFDVQEALKTLGVEGSVSSATNKPLLINAIRNQDEEPLGCETEIQTAL